MQNLFTDIPAQLLAELFDTLVESPAVQIERIVSKGHASPVAGWYEQGRNEWVVLLQGAARLVFDDDREIEMGPGDWLEIPARRKHRVAWTDPDQVTVWLAVHYP